MSESVNRDPICGICYTKFIQLDDVCWMGVCEHRAGVIAHVGSEKLKKAPKKKVMTMAEYNEQKDEKTKKPKSKQTEAL